MKLSQHLEEQENFWENCRFSGKTVVFPDVEIIPKFSQHLEKLHPALSRLIYRDMPG